jgi:NAD(P)-dependent dehydrogenase (short-subunit alcohol dehydrogenase family)
MRTSEPKCACKGELPRIHFQPRPSSSSAELVYDRKLIMTKGGNTCAGVMSLPEAATKDGFDVQIQTNHLSHFLLSSLLLPALERAASKYGSLLMVLCTSPTAKCLQESPTPSLHSPTLTGRLSPDVCNPSTSAAFFRVP